MITFILLNALIICWIVFIIKHRREKLAWLQGVTACCIIIPVAYSSLLWHEYEINENALRYGEGIYRVVVLDDPIRGLFASEERTREYLHEMEEDALRSTYGIVKSALKHAPLGYFVIIEPQIIYDGPYTYNAQLMHQVTQEVVKEFMKQQQEDRRRGVHLRPRPIKMDPNPPETTQPSDEQ